MIDQAPEKDSIVFVIDDDASLRESIVSLISSVGLPVRSFGTTAEFLQSSTPEIPACLVLDVRLPGTSGLDFQDELARTGIHIPIIFITGHGDIPMSVRAMKAGALEFLAKPFRDQDLLDAILAALEQDRMRREEESAAGDVKSKFESLTPREKEVIVLVTSGLMNKQIAGELEVSEITVKVHRGNIMRKMGARTFADLVRMAERLKLNET